MEAEAVAAQQEQAELAQAAAASSVQPAVDLSRAAVLHCGQLSMSALRAAILLHVAAQRLPTPISAGSVLSVSIKPTDGTLGTDDVILLAAWIEYKRKVLTA